MSVVLKLLYILSKIASVPSLYKLRGITHVITGSEQVVCAQFFARTHSEKNIDEFKSVFWYVEQFITIFLHQENGFREGKRDAVISDITMRASVRVCLLRDCICGFIFY